MFAYLTKKYNIQYEIHGDFKHDVVKYMSDSNSPATTVLYEYNTVLKWYRI